MDHIHLILLLLSKAVSAGAQFNGYNCDSNFHSRFPGEKTTTIYTLLYLTELQGKINGTMKGRRGNYLYKRVYFYLNFRETFYYYAHFFLF